MLYLDNAVDPAAGPLQWLEQHLPHAAQFHARVGYLDRAGVRLVEGAVRDLLDRGGEVHIVVDAHDDQPRHGDLAWLLEIFAGHGDRATVTLVQDTARMHAKVFLLTDPTGARHALVGSANFTAAGLGRNLEAGIALDSMDDGGILDRIEAAFRSVRSLTGSVSVDLGLLASLADTTKPPGGASRRLTDLLASAINRLDESIPDESVPSGFTELDRLLGGAHPGQMIIIAGRPGLGKSTLGLDWARFAACRHGAGVLLLSFEMSEAELMQRVLAAEARVPLHTINSRLLSDVDWTKVATRLGEIVEAPLYINDSCAPSIRTVLAEARRAVSEHGVRMIVVDYVQLLHVDRRVENRQQEIAEISRALKQLARELHLPVVVLSQLNRAPEARLDKRPLLSDLRDSGSLEQDADVVILVHRDDYYDRESPRAGEADLIVAKNRNGPTDVVVVAAQLHLARFIDMAVHVG